MSHSGYTIQVTSLSPNATEKDVYDFFAFSGSIEHIEIIRSGDYACTAYVTFKDPYALETAVLFNGATIADQPVCISHWGHNEDASDFWGRPWYLEDDVGSSASQSSHFISSPGEVVTLAQEVVKTMLSKGYVLGKDALIKAKEFDESHRVSATAAAKVVEVTHQVSASAATKVSELSQRIGLTDKICAAVDVAKYADEKFHVVDGTKSAASAMGRTTAAAAQAVVNSSYFSAGALWVSDALTRAAKVAADLSSHGINK